MMKNKLEFQPLASGETANGTSFVAENNPESDEAKDKGKDEEVAEKFDDKEKKDSS